MALTLSRTNRALDERIRKVATEYETAMRGQTKTRVRQIALEAKARVDSELPPNDGIAPAAPTGLAVTPQRRGAYATWDTPPAVENVARATVRVKLQSTGAVVQTTTTTATNIRISDLNPDVVYTVEVRYIDRWELIGAWTAPATVTPQRSVADEVNLSGQAILTVINGLLPNGNLATIKDATKLGDQLVVARAMAVQDAAALNLWVANAAIQSAKIASVQADKIDTGILFAAVSISSTGKISAAGATMDSGGISLAEVASQNSPPNVGPGSKISNAGVNKWVGLQAFNAAPAVARRGWGLWADGVNGGSLDGAIRLICTNGNQDPASVFSATLYMESASVAGEAGSVALGYDARVVRNLAVGTDLNVGRNINIVGSFTGQTTFAGRVSANLGMDVAAGLTITNGDFQLAPNAGRRVHQYEQTLTIPAGGYADYSHPFGSIPSEVHAWYSPAGTTQWYEVPAGPVTPDAVSKFSTTAYVRIRNNSTATIACFVRADK